MKYIELKQELLRNITDLEKHDVHLLEGKLLFVSFDKAILVKNYLTGKMKGITVHIDKPRNWPHWRKQYEAQIFLQNIPADFK